MKNKIQNLKHNFQLLRDPIALKSDDWEETSHSWRITFPEYPKLHGYYFTGLAYRVAKSGYYSCYEKGVTNAAEYKRLSQLTHRLTPHGFEELLRISKAVPPAIEDIIESLLHDSEAETMSYADWCSNCGYDTDSIRATETYKRCQESGAKLRKPGFNIPELQTYFEEKNQ